MEARREEAPAGAGTGVQRLEGLVRSHRRLVHAAPPAKVGGWGLCNNQQSPFPKHIRRISWSEGCCIFQDFLISTPVACCLSNQPFTPQMFDHHLPSVQSSSLLGKTLLRPRFSLPGLQSLFLHFALPQRHCTTAASRASSSPARLGS